MDTGSPVELFCKLSAACYEGVTSLAREVVAACLASDLGLPVADPYLVDISPHLSAAPAEVEIAVLLQDSSPVGFGSAKVGNQFSVWTSATRVTSAMLPVALSAIVFDAVIDNVDRRESNPNCLVSGDQIRLIDHELAFPARANLIGWRPPWKAGSLAWLDRNDRHIFCVALKKRRLDVSPLLAVWSRVSDARLQEYRAAIPPEWNQALPAIDEALERIRHARDHMDGVISEIERVLQ